MDEGSSLVIPNTVTELPCDLTGHPVGEMETYLLWRKGNICPHKHMRMCSQQVTLTKRWEQPDVDPQMNEEVKRGPSTKGSNTGPATAEMASETQKAMYCMISLTRSVQKDTYRDKT